MDDLRELQFSREFSQYRMTERKYRQSIENTTDKTERSTAYKIMVDRYLPTASIALEEKLLESYSGAKQNKEAKQQLLRLEPEMAIYLGFRVLFSFKAPQISVQEVCVQIGEQLQEHLQFQRLMEKLKEDRKKTGTEDARKACVVQKILEDSDLTQSIKHLHKLYTRINKFIHVERENWDNNTEYKTGEYVLNQIIKTSGLWEIQRIQKGPKKTILMVQPTSDCEQILEDLHGKLDVLNPQMLPMVCPPEKWTNWYNGGLLTNATTRRSPLIRTRKKEIRNVLQEGDNQVFLDAVNALQATPWTINRQVFEAAWTLYHEEDAGIGGLPYQDVAKKMPSPPWKDKEDHERMKKVKPPEYIDYIAYRHRIWEEWADQKSKRLRTGMSLSVAREYLEFPEFWFTYYGDWRTRLYPVQTSLSPQGDDLQKGIMMFAKGKPLGTSGIRWFLIHGANVYGEDKLSYEDRIQWVYDNHDFILECANNPLDGTRNWANSDKPFCFLAWALEYKAWVESDYSEDFVSYIPVQVDGSCSGLQHLSAMTRSRSGAVQVNLVPSRLPADFYTTIKDKSEEICERWLNTEETPKIYRDICKLLKGNIKRIYVKRPSMTLFYSATRQGFIEQIKDELRKEDTKSKQRVFESAHDNHQIAQCLADIVIEALKSSIYEPFVAMEFIKHLSDCCTLEGINLEWEMPTGMKTCQAYKKSKKKRIRSWFGDVSYTTTLSEETPQIDKTESKNGSSPNFVHSMDASHLQHVVVKCVQEGISSFAMIHDSFGTHACDVERLQEITRNTFADIYTEDWLQKLYLHTQSRLKGDGLARIDKLQVVYGDLDINETRSAEYLFS